MADLPPQTPLSLTRVGLYEGEGGRGAAETVAVGTLGWVWSASVCVGERVVVTIM